MSTETPPTPPPNNNQAIKIVLAIFGSMMLGAAIVGWYTTRTYHYTAVQPGVLYRLGNRGISEFTNAVGGLHPRTIVSLIDDNELADPNKPQFQQEATYLQKHHVRLERIPVKLGGWPTSDDITKFIAIVSDPTNRPVFVHCAQGVRRTGMFVAAYQMSDLGYDKEKAKAAIESFGHSDRVIADVKTFIDNYDPATHAVATSQPSTTNE